MKKKNLDKNFTRLVVISILLVFLTTSANSAFVNNQAITNDNYSSPPCGPLGDDYYYEWRDDFDNEQKIDMTKSWWYVVEGGVAKMKNTYPVWDDPNWEKLKPITVTNSGGGLTDYALNFIVEYDPDMQSDYDDIRFKHEDAPTNFLDYWIESYDSTEVSVWVKVPNLPSGTSKMYLFYDNPNANSESDFGSVFTDWQEEWANDEQITWKGDEEGCWDPDVCYGNGHFLVAWEEGQPYWPLHLLLGFKQEIRASIYLPSGGDPVVFDKRVFSDVDYGYTYFRNENPSIAYGGSGWFFVAWEHYEPTNTPLNPPSSTTMDIYARMVKKSGSDLQLGSVITVCDASNCQADANVEFDSVNNRYMVVWEDARDSMSDYDIWARLYDTNGNPVGSEKEICGDANSQCEPWAAFDPTNEQYFIVWEEGINAANGPFRLKGGIFDKDLNTISTFIVAEPSDWPYNDVDYNFPCVEFDEDSERFLVTWNDGDISSNDWWGNVWGKIYDTSGIIKVNQFLIRSGNFVRTDIVPYLSEAFLVSYDNNHEVFGKLVSAEGDLYGNDIQLSASPAAEADWANMATDGSEIFVAWEDIRIVYNPPAFDNFPDAFGNIWNLNIPDGSDITITFEQEKELILEAQITSKPIEPANLDTWYQFGVDFDSSITFDILDGSATTVLIENADDGEDLSIIDPNQYSSLCLRAHFTRNNPSYTPTLNWWRVLYEGIDAQPPVTTVDYIDGVQGIDPWFISECVTIWLKAIDYPPDTGSGINLTYYTIDGGSPQIYNEGSGIHICSYEPDWWGTWVVNFWSVDNTGNVEDRTKPENYRTIYIDARRPEVEIYEPREEAEVEVPFWVKANASDNAGIERVDFDIEPFEQRPNLPWSDYTPPYEWECNEEPISRALAAQPYPSGVGVQIRATAYDASGQYWIHEIFVQITNWNSRPRIITIPNFIPISEKLKLGIVIDNKLNVEISEIENADAMEFVATRIFTRKQTTIWDNDLSDGISASFDIPTGFYKITTYSYKEGEEIASDLVSRVFFIHR